MLAHFIRETNERILPITETMVEVLAFCTVYILRIRAELALSPNAWNDKTLQRIAELADGDARVAIQTLKTAAYSAENDLLGKIHEKDIKKGFNSSKDLKRTYLLNKLTTHHRLLYDLVKEKKTIHSGTLWKVYLERCAKIEEEPDCSKNIFRVHEQAD